MISRNEVGEEGDSTFNDQAVHTGVEEYMKKYSSHPTPNFINGNCEFVTPYYIDLLS
ncbi:predicted protein [Botrytis cinerea T4]|uniref:Uncharacterized protein n=1 Tax=Botryotinia fuckeliana (strain T4) TaxID=999810 RepID=G2Y0X8_BOTF4|nr:predicted protein [Botrytis cinerea T4]